MSYVYLGLDSEGLRISIGRNVYLLKPTEAAGWALDFDGAVAKASESAYNNVQGHLATINSAGEDAALRQALPEIWGGPTQIPVTSMPWIAASDQDSEGNWIWTAGPETGKTTTYSNWASGQPGSDTGRNHAVWWSTGWSASTGDSADSHGYIIEFENAINHPPEVAGFYGEPIQFSLAENAALGKLVGRLAATDPNGDPLTFTIGPGALDPDEDGIAAFAISRTGRITVKDRDDIDFEATRTFSFEVNVSDGDLVTTVPVVIDLNNVNEVPTGGVFISGTASKGSRLSVVSTLHDPDGPSEASIQWLRNGAPIKGATGVNYVVALEDAGKSLAVSLSYTDGGSFSRTVTSPALASGAKAQLPPGEISKDANVYLAYPSKHEFPVVKSSQIPVFTSAMAAIAPGEPLQGWHLVTGTDLGLPTSGAVSLVDGLYTNRNAAALVAEATLNGHRTLLVAFQQSNDAEDFKTDFRDINAHYPLYSNLLKALDREIADGSYDLVLACGWSLGGTMAQMYMKNYTGPVPAYALTVGSPGFRLGSSVSDDRVLNYADGNDLFVSFSPVRASARSLPDAQLKALSELFGYALGIPGDLYYTSLPFMTENYYQYGKVVVLDGPQKSAVQLSMGLAKGDYSSLYAHLLDNYRGKLGGVKQDPFNLNAGMKGSASNNQIFGTSSANALDGLAGNDTLRGHEGADTLKGGSGADWFVFDTAPVNTKPDQILDFEPGVDKLVLDDDVFGRLESARGGAPLPKAYFATGAAALDSNDYLVFDPGSKTLFFDADGKGGEAAVALATVALIGNKALGAADFLIVV